MLLATAVVLASPLTSRSVLAQNGAAPLDTLLEARRLSDARQFGRAARLLDRYVATHPRDAEAVRMLGTLQYWRGDYSAAVRHFGEALRLNPGDGESRRQLLEILAATAPWVTIRSAGLRDDQPVRTIGGGAEAGFFLTPLTSVRLDLATEWLGGTRSELAAANASLRLAGYAPSARLEWQLTGGLFRRDSLAGVAAGATEWTGDAAVGLRLTDRIALRAGLAREPYLRTDASLDAALHTEVASARVAWNTASGWLGEAAWDARRFEDENIVSSAYAWLLAPLVQRQRFDLRAGYAFGWQDSRESRWVFTSAGTGGRYEPYYTPDRVAVHSATGALGAHGRVLSLRVDGAVAIRATEWIPSQSSGSGGPSVPGVPGGTTPGGGDGTALREFDPWRVRGVLSLAPFRTVTAEVTGEHSRTAYYASSTYAVRLTWRGLPRLGDAR